MIYIRTDANEIIATGHVMRCLTIADELIRLGEDVCFVVSDSKSLPLIEERKFNYIVTYSKWSDVNPRDEYEQLKLYIKPTDVLLVDSYCLNNDYLKCMRKLYCKLASFDDLFLEKKDADIVINYNVFYRKFDYETRYKGCNCKLLLGEKYVPLRKQFLETEPIEKVRTYDRPHVLLMCGGGDSRNFICSCLEYIQKNNQFLFLNIEWKVVIGRYYPHIELLENLKLQYGNIEIFQNVKDMARLMKECDMCITAASTVLYESCRMLLPTLFVVVAEDQRYDAEAFSKDGMMIYCGNFADAKGDTLPNILEELEIIIYNTGKQQKIKDSMKLYIDGQGARRIAKELLEGFKTASPL